MPRTRFELYACAISRVAEQLEGANFLIDLYAIAWDLLVKQERRLSSARIEPEILSALLDAKIPLIRRIFADTYEFRHDQMRLFLAAQYLLQGYKSIDLLLEFLRGSDIWKIRPIDQEELWEAYVAGVSSCDSLGLLWLFALEKVERVVFQHAIQAQGQSLLCDWVPSVPESKQRGFEDTHIQSV